MARRWQETPLEADAVGGGPEAGTRLFRPFFFNPASILVRAISCILFAVDAVACDQHQEVVAASCRVLKKRAQGVGVVGGASGKPLKKEPIPPKKEPMRLEESRSSRNRVEVPKV